MPTTKQPLTSQSSAKSGRSKKIRPKGSMPSAWFSLPTDVQAMEDDCEQSLLTRREEGREQWSSEYTFLLATIGSAVGLGNIWRFPVLAANHGGPTFIIAYFIVLLFIGMPMMTLELTLGQKFQGGDVDAFGAINPRFRGIGLASVFCSYITSTYYTVILSWAAIYFFESFMPDLPYSVHSNLSNSTFEDYRAGAEKHFAGVVQAAQNVDMIHGNFNWKVFGALTFIWLAIYICVFRGIRIVSHVVKFTATAPIIIIIILAAMGCTKPGAGDGVLNYIGTIDLSYFNNRQIWIDAIGQVFFSLGLCMGLITAYSSFNPKHQNISRDGKIICISDMLVSIIAGFSVYEMMGFVNNACLERGVAANCNFYRDQSPFNLAFVSYPIGIALSDIPHLWGILFFSGLLLLGIDSAFSMILAFTTVLDDAWFTSKFRVKKPVMLAIVCGVGYLLGFLYLFDSGLIYLDIVDHYISNWCLVLIGFVQTVACGWIYQAPYQFRRVGRFSVILYDLCFFVAITLGVIIALSGTEDSEVDVIWVGIFIGTFVWVFGLVAAVLLSKGRVPSYREKVWCIAGWHGPDMIRRMVNKNYDPEWEPNDLKDEGNAVLKCSFISLPFGFMIKYIIPGILLLLVGLALSKDLQVPYNMYPLPFNILGALIVMFVVGCMLIFFIFPRLWYHPDYAGGKSYLKWVFIPRTADCVKKDKMQT